MRIQHGEVILPSKRSPSKKSKANKGANNSGGESDGEGAGGDTTMLEGEEEHEGEIVWTEEELALFEKHADLDRYFVANVVMKAKWAYLIGEHESLAGELEAVGIREAELGAECEELMRRIVRREIP